MAKLIMLPDELIVISSVTNLISIGVNLLNQEWRSEREGVVFLVLNYINNTSSVQKSQ